MSAYKEAITNCMSALSQRSDVLFLGYNVRCGHRMYGTLDKCNKQKLIEMPVAENLIMGAAMGLSIQGYQPIVCFERMNFVLPAMDAIVSHLDKLPEISQNQIKFNVVVRCVVGSDKPLDPGVQHLGDFTEMLKKATNNIEIVTLKSVDSIFEAYQLNGSTKPRICVEYKQLYS